MKLVSVTEMRAIEAEADRRRVSYETMMERAGAGVAETVRRYGSVFEIKAALALVGSGNNGGDALVALADLAQSGWQARAYLLRERPDDPLVERLQTQGGEVLLAQDDAKYEKLDEWLKRSSVLIDGVLGTGVKLPLKEDIARLLNHTRSHPMLPFVVAVDCPSGIDCDSGEMADETIPADLTLCMEAIKHGLVRFPAFERVGEMRVVRLGLPADLESLQKSNDVVASPEWVRGVLPRRGMQDHKGSYGTAMVVAGSVNYTGAALLAAKAAYRVGVGLVQLAVVSPLHTALAGQAPEVTWLILPAEMGAIAAAAANVVYENLGRTTAMLIGPGLGRDEDTAEFMRRLIGGKAGRPSKSRIGCVVSSDGEATAQPAALPPLVVDADGLNLLGSIPGWQQKLAGESILTPHPGEMAGLTGLSVAEIQAERWQIARKYAAEWGQVVVLKGALTVVAAPDGRIGVVAVATPALARAGTGDVLAGVIVGLRAQRLPPFEAALAGAYLHGRAGVLAEDRLGHPAAVIAGDVLDQLPSALCETLEQ